MENNRSHKSKQLFRVGTDYRPFLLSRFTFNQKLVAVLQCFRNNVQTKLQDLLLNTVNEVSDVFWMRNKFFNSFLQIMSAKCDKTLYTSMQIEYLYCVFVFVWSLNNNTIWCSLLFPVFPTKTLRQLKKTRTLSSTTIQCTPAKPLYSKQMFVPSVFHEQPLIYSKKYSSDIFSLVQLAFLTQKEPSRNFLEGSLLASFIRAEYP